MFTRIISWSVSLLFLFIFTILIDCPTFGQIIVGTISRPGLAPDGLAVYETGNKLCVFDDRTNHLLLYDGATLALEKEIVFSQPIYDPFSFGGMTIDEAEGKLYICIGIEWGYPDRVKVAIVDLVSDSLLTEIPIPGLLPQSMNGMAYDSELDQIFVADIYAVYIVDCNANAVTKIDLPSDGAHYHMTLNPITHEVFFANSGVPKLRIVDGITHQLSEVDAPKAFGMTVNWLENKVYIIQFPYSCWIYDRNTGSTKVIHNQNDAEELYYNPGSNTVYTDAEIACQLTIFDGRSDNFFNLPIRGATTTMGFRYSSRHVYFVNEVSIGVFDETTGMFENIAFNHPHVGPSFTGSQFIAVNQVTGRVYIVHTDYYGSPDENPIWVLQDTEMMVRSNILLGGRITLVLDPETYGIVEMRHAHFESSYQALGMAYNSNGSRLYQTSYFDWWSPTTQRKGYLTVHAGSGAWDIYGRSAGNFNACIGLYNMDYQNPITPVPSPDGKKIYVTCSAINSVKTMDVTIDSNLSVINEITVEKNPWGAALTPEGDELYVANKGSNTVSVIDTKANIITKTIAVGSAPWGVAINPSGTLTYVANSGAGTVSVIDITTKKMIATIAVGSDPHWIAFAPDGKYAYLTNNDGNTVSVIDAGTHTVTQTVPLSTHPEGICFEPDGSKAFVAQDSGMTIIDTSDLSTTFISYYDEIKDQYYYLDTRTCMTIANPTSRFAGRVTDQQGLPVVDAFIRALQEGVERGMATTNASGDFCIFNLQSGTYDLEVSRSDFPLQSLAVQQVDVGQTKIVHFSVLTSLDTFSELPRQFFLEQNYPNPFNPNTLIRFYQPMTSRVSIKIFNCLGNEIKNLTEQVFEAGWHEVVWDCTNNKEQNVSTGIYLYRMEANNYICTKKAILLK